MRILPTLGLRSCQLTRIQIYGWLEVATGSIKIIFSYYNHSDTNCNQSWRLVKWLTDGLDCVSVLLRAYVLTMSSWPKQYSALWRQV